MKYLQIKNKGEVDINAFTLIGASTKRDDDTKIGFFGSGNKYAISYFLRNKHEFKVFSGTNEIKFETTKKLLREEAFDVLIVDGRETSITLQMGIQWKLWQAVREVYSNALDEGLLSFEIVDSYCPKEDETIILIEATPEVEDLMFNKDEFFLSRKDPIFECEYGAIYPKTGSKARIYRKGIKAYDTNKNSLFDYDLNKLIIDENRMAMYSWQPAEHMWNILYSCTKKEVIRKVLNEIKTERLIEREINNGIITPNDSLMSTQWLEVTEDRQVFTENFAGWLNDKERIITDFVPAKLYNTLTEKIGDSIKPKSMQFSENGLPYIEAVINNVRADVLSKALDFFTDAGFLMDYKVKVVDFRDKKVIGSVDKDNQLILLDVQSLDLGVDQAINTIVEEYIHLKFGVADETRGFQNAIITEFINYMKSKLN